LINLIPESSQCYRAVNRPHKPEGAFAQTWTHTKARMPTVHMMKTVYRYRIWGCMFLKPGDLENVRVSSLLSLDWPT
jgi:hypothetical protein